ncbi:hypothetical protein [Rhizobium mayense]|uniref:hypothetical protein n=1 Tax=Rhizobium mayense TaxID=1312184 RepID=UPI00398C49A0
MQAGKQGDLVRRRCTKTSNATDVAIAGALLMKWKLLDRCQHIVLLQEQLEVLPHGTQWKLTDYRISAGPQHDDMRDVALLLRPFLKEINDVVEAAYFLNEVLPSHEKRAVKHVTCHCFLPLPGVPMSEKFRKRIFLRKR